MLRPRRAKQKPVQSHEIVGLLPSEEAAIQRALMASIAKKPPTKESPTGGTASPISSPPTKKFKKSLRTSPKLPNTNKNSRSTTPNSLSTSPFSLSSNISFLSTDSVSSNTWSPSPVAKAKGPKKMVKKKLSPPQQKPTRSKSISPRSQIKIKSKTPPSPKRQVAIKSAQIAKVPVQKRRARLIACVVRKKAVEEPRNEAGLTVDEILKSVANMRDGSISPKLGKKLGSKQKSSPKSPPNSRGSKSRQNSPGSAKSTPKRSPGKSKSPSQELKSPTTLKLTSKLTLKLSKSSINLTAPTKAYSKLSGSDGKCDESAQQKSPSQSPNSYSYQAQRKYASNHSPPFRSSNQELASPPGLKDTPKTEDFLHFLCLRGSSAIPDHYKKFDFPWTPIKQAQVKNTKETNLSKKLNRDKVTTALGLTAKKLDFNSMAK